MDTTMPDDNNIGGPSGPEGEISVCVISGTVRPGNYTNMAVTVVARALEEKQKVSVDLVDVASLDLAFPGQDSGSGDAAELTKRVARASAVVLATPEYHGGFSAFLKLVIENLGFPSALQGKPVALVGVAGGSIGAIKSLEQLRSVCSHVGALVLPGPVSVAGVRNKFTPTGECTDQLTQELLEDVAEKLVAYMHQYVCPRYALEALVRSESMSAN